MKIKLYSDLHIEFFDFDPSDDGEDLVILAGDIETGTNGVDWIIDMFKDRLDKVIYLPGNHEFYHNDLMYTKQAIKEACNTFNIKSLVFPEDKIIIGDYAFLGGTLWTAFDFWHDQIASKLAVQRSLNDYHCIMRDGIRLQVQDTISEHKESMAGFEQTIKELDKSKKIVMATHMAPSSMSSLGRYKNDPITAAYCSNLEDWILDRPEIVLWVHGHMHNSSDYNIGDCRVVANPRGYANSRRVENPNFDPHLIIEI